MVETTLTVSEALKNHLRTVVGTDEAHQDPEITTDAVDTLYDSVIYLIENPYETEIEIKGYDETLNSPVKVPKRTLNRVKSLQEQLGARDYEQTIRQQANIAERDVGEEPIELTDWQ